MNKRIENVPLKSKPTSLFGGRTKDLLLVGALGLVLFFTAWKIFQSDSKTQETASFQYSEAETKVMRILQEIDGVGAASVVVSEREEEIKSVVVVCEGANNLRVIMNIREAVAAALGTEEKIVKIYLKKE